MPLTMAAAQGQPIGTGVSYTSINSQAPPSWQTPPAGGSGREEPQTRPLSLGPQSPDGGAAVVDGKQFFREARNNLSYEAFNDFLSSIKRLNNQQQTREETLQEARRIFGNDL